MGKKFKKHPLEYEKIKQIYQLINNSAGALNVLDEYFKRHRDEEITDDVHPVIKYIKNDAAKASYILYCYLNNEIEN